MPSDPDAFSALDGLIDDYLRHDKRHRPKLGYPSRAAGTEAASSNRSWESADELLDSSVEYIRMSGMSGAWASLTVRQEQALRIDASNRKAGTVVFRIAHLNEFATAAEVRAAKKVLRHLLLQRNVIC